MVTTMVLFDNIHRRIGLSADHWNAIFKQGRRAGHEDVALEILKHPPIEAHRIAQEFLDHAQE